MGIEMNIQKITKFYWQVSNFIVNIRKTIQYFREPEYKRLIQRNIKYKNLYEGKRCFIIGSGPSLSEQNIECLKDEYVFTLNGMPFYEKYPSLKSNFHIMMDPRYFELRYYKHPSLRTVEIFSKINTESTKPVCFFPASAYRFLRDKKITKLLDSHFIDTELFLWEGYNKKIEFDRPVTAPQSVAHCAIELAVYMGFKQIYLLGSDCTGIIQDISTVYGTFSNAHIYDITDKMKNNKLQHIYSMEQIFDGHAKILHDYKTLYNYCASRQVELVNCSSKTIIQSIPRASLNKIIKKGKYELPKGK